MDSLKDREYEIQNVCHWQDNRKYQILYLTVRTSLIHRLSVGSRDHNIHNIDCSSSKLSIS